MSKKIAYTSMIAAFAIMLSYVEYIIPLGIGIPGVKLGLANFAVLMALYHIGAGEAVCINIIRIFVIGVLFGNAISILFSIAGATVSFIVMMICKKTDKFGIFAVSIAGSVAHNIGQIMVAAYIVKTSAVFAYVPILIISGVVTGAVIGSLVKMLDKKTAKILKQDLL